MKQKDAALVTRDSHVMKDLRKIKEIEQDYDIRVEEEENIPRVVTEPYLQTDIREEWLTNSMALPESREKIDLVSKSYMTTKQPNDPTAQRIQQLEQQVKMHELQE